MIKRALVAALVIATGAIGTAQATVYKVEGIGDSITVGNGCPPTGTDRDSWRLQLYNDAFAEGVQLTFVGVSFLVNNSTPAVAALLGGHHDAIGGHECADLITDGGGIATALSGAAPDLVTLACGTNDAFHGTQANTAASLVTLLNAIRTYSATVDILFVNPIPPLDPTAAANMPTVRSAILAEYASRIAGGDKHIQLVDMSGYGTGVWSSTYYSSLAGGANDPFHPSCGGYQLIADTDLWPAMRVSPLLRTAVWGYGASQRHAATIATSIMAGGN